MKQEEKANAVQTFIIEGIVTETQEMEMIKEGTTTLFYQTISVTLKTGKTIEGLTLWNDMLFRWLPEIGDKVRIVLKAVLLPNCSMQKTITGYQKIS